jgi:hypothetical protein
MIAKILACYLGMLIAGAVLAKKNSDYKFLIAVMFGIMMFYSIIWYEGLDRLFFMISVSGFSVLWGCLMGLAASRGGDIEFDAGDLEFALILVLIPPIFLKVQFRWLMKWLWKY